MFKLNKLFFLILIIVFIFVDSYSVENVTSCGGSIGMSGEYQLNASLTSGAANCIEINAGMDVVLDCQGYNITGPGWGNGIYVNTVLSNITIRNCNVDNFSLNIYVFNSQNVVLENIFSRNSMNNGIRFLNSNNNSLVNYRSENDEGSLAFMLSNDNNIVDLNIYDTKASPDIYLGDSSNNIILNMNFTNTTSELLDLQGSSSNNSFSNLMANDVMGGISFYELASNNLFDNITITNFSGLSDIVSFCGWSGDYPQNNTFVNSHFLDSQKIINCDNDWTNYSTNVFSGNTYDFFTGPPICFPGTNSICDPPIVVAESVQEKSASIFPFGSIILMSLILVVGLFVFN